MFPTLTPDQRDSIIESANGAYFAALQVSSSHHVAQEVAQDIVERFIRKSIYFDDLVVASNYGWISGRNRAVDICRSRAIEEKYLTKIGGFMGLEATQNLDTSTIEVMASISRIEGIDANDREVINLIILGLSVSEIRQILSIESNGQWRNTKRRIQKILIEAGIVKQTKSGAVHLDRQAVAV